MHENYQKCSTSADINVTAWIATSTARYSLEMVPRGWGPTQPATARPNAIKKVKLLAGAKTLVRLRVL